MITELLTAVAISTCAIQERSAHIVVAVRGPAASIVCTRLLRAWSGGGDFWEPAPGVVIAKRAPRDRVCHLVRGKYEIVIDQRYSTIYGRGLCGDLVHRGMRQVIP